MFTAPRGSLLTNAFAVRPNNLESFWSLLKREGRRSYVVGGKKNNRKVQKQGTKKNQKAPHNLTPPKRWWNQMLDSNKVIAAGTVGGVIALIGIAYYQGWQWHQEHRPRVVFSRPLEMLEPMTCDPATGQGGGKVRVWIKNIGNVDAQSVIAFPFVHLIPEMAPNPTRPGQSIQDILDMGQSICNQTRAPTGINAGLPLAAGREISIDMPGSAASPVHYLGQTRMQAFSTSFVTYLEPDKKTPHTTGITEWLMLPKGDRAFVCGTPIEGHFDTYPGGSCEN